MMRDLYGRRQWLVAVAGAPQLVPTRTARRVGETVAPRRVVEVVDRLRAEVGDERCRAALQLELLVGVPGVHDYVVRSSACRAAARARSVSFSTLPAAFTGSSSTSSTARGTL